MKFLLYFGKAENSRGILLKIVNEFTKIFVSDNFNLIITCDRQSTNGPKLVISSTIAFTHDSLFEFTCEFAVHNQRHSFFLSPFSFQHLFQYFSQIRSFFGNYFTCNFIQENFSLKPPSGNLFIYCLYFTNNSRIFIIIIHGYNL